MCKRGSQKGHLNPTVAFAGHTGLSRLHLNSADTDKHNYYERIWQNMEQKKKRTGSVKKKKSPNTFCTYSQIHSLLTRFRNVHLIQIKTKISWKFAKTNEGLQFSKFTVHTSLTVNFTFTVNFTKRRKSFGRKANKHKKNKKYYLKSSLTYKTDTSPSLIA